MFYLSLAPQLFQLAVDNLCASDLAAPGPGWRRLVCEKPFGTDLATAQALNRRIHTVFKESEVYRIDHYLGKETVQNMLVLRFANAIFEPLWNRSYVDAVIITVAEEIPVGHRASYYEPAGVVRDMIQNHLMQLLSLAAMEPPDSTAAEALRDKKVEVLQAIRRWKPSEAGNHAVRGQYRGYLQEQGVAPGSVTPTYAALRLYVDNWRWQDVPFYLRTGKSMAEKLTEVVIRFRQPPHRVFAHLLSGVPASNTLGMCIQPDEGVHLRFEVKVPGGGRKIDLRPVDMKFHYESAFPSGSLPEAYVRLVQDALDSDPSLFIRNDYIEEAWRVVDPLLEAWESDAGNPPLHVYEPGSWGPAAADEFIAADGGWVRGCVDVRGR